MKEGPSKPPGHPSPPDVRVWVDLELMVGKLVMVTDVQTCLYWKKNKQVDAFSLAECLLWVKLLLTRCPRGPGPTQQGAASDERGGTTL